MSDCINGLVHDFDSCEESEYCFNGCGEKWTTYTIKKLQAENESLEKWKSETLYHIPHIDIHKNDCQKELSNLKTEIEKLIKCVEFYADGDIYRDDDKIGISYPEIEVDEGAKARNCLEEVKQENKK